MDKNFISWLKFKCKEDYELAKQNNLYYAYESFENLLEKITQLKNKTNLSIPQKHFYLIEKYSIEDYEYIKDDFKIVNYQNICRLINWYSLTISDINKITL